MKRTVGIICLISLIMGKTGAQTIDSPVYQPRPEFAVGAGYGLAMYAFSFRNGLDRKNVGFDLQHQGPAFTFDYAHPVHKRMSVGPAVSAQNLRVLHWMDNPPSPTTRVRDLLRINVGARMLFNYDVHPDWKFYFGFRAGLTLWRELNEGQVVDGMHLNLTFWPSAQVLGGVRYWMGNMGVGMEAAMGTAPYLVQAHIAHRF